MCLHETSISVGAMISGYAEMISGSAEMISGSAAPM